AVRVRPRGGQARKMRDERAILANLPGKKIHAVTDQRVSATSNARTVRIVVVKDLSKLPGSQCHVGRCHEIRRRVNDVRAVVKHSGADGIVIIVPEKRTDVVGRGSVLRPVIVANVELHVVDGVSVGRHRCGQWHVRTRNSGTTGWRYNADDWFTSDRTEKYAIGKDSLRDVRSFIRKSQRVEIIAEQRRRLGVTKKLDVDRVITGLQSHPAAHVRWTMFAVPVHNQLTVHKQFAAGV